MPPRRHVPQNKLSDGNTGLRLVFAIGLMFQMPSFVMQLTWEPGAEQASGSLILQTANLACFFIGAALVLGDPDRKQILHKGAIPLCFVGVALLSVLWSFNRAATLRQTFVLLSTTLFALAICSRLSPKACLQLIIRMMTMACLLSVIWVILYPETSVHQATDVHQNQHAGLWRGIFSHKQGLGVVAGLTTGLLLFYGSVAFPMVIFRLAALGIAFTCMIGSGSATGLLITVILTGLLYLSYWILHAPPRQRRAGIWAFIAMLVIFYFAFHFNLMNFVLPLLGKSADLTGRTDCWPVVLENLRNTAPILGGGYAGGLQDVVAPECSIDNGFIEKIVEFGYVGGSLLVVLAARALWGSVRVLLSSRAEDAALRAFPLNMLLIQLFIGISETYFMSKSISWIMTIVSMYHVALYQGAASGARPPRPSLPRSARGAAYGRPGALRQ